MFLHAFEPLPRWRSPLLRAVAPLYRNGKKKTEGRYTDELGQTAHCTLTTAPRRSTCTTNPPSSKHRRGVRAGGRRGGGGRKRGGENNTNAAPFAPLLLFRSMLLLFRPDYFSLVSRQLTTHFLRERRLEEWKNKREK